MDEPFFSVIIPCHNSSPFLRDCLDRISQFNSSLKAEFIIVDDGSTDRTSEIADEFCNSDSRFTLVRSKKQNGPGSARNLGLNVAKGAWIIFLDSDDHLHPSSLNTIYKAIKDAPTSDLDFLIHTALPGFLEKNLISYDLKLFQINKRVFIKRFLRFQTYGWVSHIVVKNSYLRKFGIRFSKGFHEDIDFAFKIYLNSEQILYLDRPIYNNNGHEGSITRTISEKHIGGIVRSWREIRTQLILRNQFQNFELDFLIGAVAIIATRLRCILHFSSNLTDRKKLVNQLRASVNTLGIPDDFLFHLRPTTYARVTNILIQTITDSSPIKEKEIHVLKECENEFSKWYICDDLQLNYYHSKNGILACNWFFKNNGICKGRVRLPSPEKFSNLSFHDIRESKKELIFRINRGDSVDCWSCKKLKRTRIESLEINPGFL